jgi:outer membrane protein assembly factor BamA
VPLSRLALALLVPCVLALAPAARADEPSSQDIAGPQGSPAKRAVLAGEDRAQGSDLPQLDPPLDFGELLGKPILRIDVRAEGGRWPRVQPITVVELGEPLSLEAARRALRELLATGYFARASAEAVPEREGAALRLFVLPRRLIATVQITGGALERSATLDAAKITEGGEVTGPMLSEISRRIRAFYAQHGYPAAVVTVDTADTDDPMRVVFAIDIEAGAPRTVSQRVFIIEPAADRELGALKQEYAFGAGDRVDELQFAEADRDMAELLRKNGFHRAEVAHRTVHVGQWSYLYVYLSPGPRIVPAFDGNRAFDADALEEALDLENATETKAEELEDRLRAFYVRRGFLDVEVSAKERGGAKDPIHYLVFTVREHEQVRVTRRVFPCLSGPLSADDVGTEIQSFLEEDLPGAELFTLPDATAVSELFGPTRGAGGRARPVDLNPAMTYDPETYERALKHLRELYYSKGYLNAVVGPISVLRATCARNSPPGGCIPEKPRERVVAQCKTDELTLPAPEPDVADALSCRPDPARHVDCASEVTLRIPIHLGPQTTLYDLAFEGNKNFSERGLSEVAELDVGDPLSTLELDASRLRVLDAYRNLGYAYAEVRTSIEPSPDRTRARARFIITERERVTVAGFVVRGASRTDEALILRRVALRQGEPYRQADARLSEERIGTLGTFASVSVALEDPDVPQKNKRVIITVVEQLPQYLDPRIGFSTGEGVRFAFEYGHRNIGGLAIAVTLRIQLSYLIDLLILDDAVRENYGKLRVSERLERRDTISINFPEIGLGPLVSLSMEGIDVRDNQRDFGLTKQAFIPTVTYRPRRSLTTQLATSAELNDVGIFNEDALSSAISLLRVPQGRTIALAQRLNFSWDGRDSPFAATTGVLIAAGAEHVNAFPSDIGDNPATINSHFIRFTGRVAGYVPLTAAKKTVVAMSMSAGYNLQLDAESQTYPDRLFFLGGVDSLRAFLADSVVPEDVAQRILSGARDNTGGQLTVDDVPIRGGDVALNPRAELRFPLGSVLQGGLFLDTGNLWVDPSAIDFFALRYAAGAGLRIGTPIGPLALDYGINLIRREWEDFGAFHFSIGLF